jgi:hypothetical protein
MSRALSREGILIGSLCEELIDENLLQAVRTVLPLVPPALARERWMEFLDSDALESGFWTALNQEMLTDPLHFASVGWWDITFGKYRGERREFFAIMPYYWPFMKFDIAAAVRSNIILLKATREFLPLRKDEYLRAFNTALRGRWLIGYHALPQYDRLREKFLLGSARLRMARVGVAAEQFRKDHGRWPATAAELPGLTAEDIRDPFSTVPLVLSRRGQELAVSSVGPGNVVWRLKP